MQSDREPPLKPGGTTRTRVASETESNGLIFEPQSVSEPPISEAGTPVPPSPSSRSVAGAKEFDFRSVPKPPPKVHSPIYSRKSMPPVTDPPPRGDLAGSTSASTHDLYLSDSDEAVTSPKPPKPRPDRSSSGIITSMSRRIPSAPPTREGGSSMRSGSHAGRPPSAAHVAVIAGQKPTDDMMSATFKRFEKMRHSESPTLDSKSGPMSPSSSMSKSESYSLGRFPDTSNSEYSRRTRSKPPPRPVTSGVTAAGAGAHHSVLHSRAPPPSSKRRPPPPSLRGVRAASAAPSSSTITSTHRTVITPLGGASDGLSFAMRSKNGAEGSSRSLSAISPSHRRGSLSSSTTSGFSHDMIDLGVEYSSMAIGVGSDTYGDKDSEMSESRISHLDYFEREKSASVRRGQYSSSSSSKTGDWIGRRRNETEEGISHARRRATDPLMASSLTVESGTDMMKLTDSMLSDLSDEDEAHTGDVFRDSTLSHSSTMSSSHQSSGTVRMRRHVVTAAATIATDDIGGRIEGEPALSLVDGDDDYADQSSAKGDSVDSENEDDKIVTVKVQRVNSAIIVDDTDADMRLLNDKFQSSPTPSASSACSEDGRSPTDPSLATPSNEHLGLIAGLTKLAHSHSAPISFDRASYASDSDDSDEDYARMEHRSLDHQSVQNGSGYHSDSELMVLEYEYDGLGGSRSIPFDEDESPKHRKTLASAIKRRPKTKKQKSRKGSGGLSIWKKTSIPMVSSSKKSPKSLGRSRTRKRCAMTRFKDATEEVTAKLTRKKSGGSSRSPSPSRSAGRSISALPTMGPFLGRSVSLTTPKPTSPIAFPSGDGSTINSIRNGGMTLVDYPMDSPSTEIIQSPSTILGRSQSSTLDRYSGQGPTSSSSTVPSSSSMLVSSPGTESSSTPLSSAEERSSISPSTEKDVSRDRADTTPPHQSDSKKRRHRTSSKLITTDLGPDYHVPYRSRGFSASIRSPDASPSRVLQPASYGAAMKGINEDSVMSSGSEDIEQRRKRVMKVMQSSEKQESNGLEDSDEDDSSSVSIPPDVTIPPPPSKELIRDGELVMAPSDRAGRSASALVSPSQRRLLLKKRRRQAAPPPKKKRAEMMKIGGDGRKSMPPMRHGSAGTLRPKLAGVSSLPGGLRVQFSDDLEHGSTVDMDADDEFLSPIPGMATVKRKSEPPKALQNALKVQVSSLDLPLKQGSQGHRASVGKTIGAGSSGIVGELSSIESGRFRADLSRSLAAKKSHMIRRKISVEGMTDVTEVPDQDLSPMALARETAESGKRSSLMHRIRSLGSGGIPESSKEKRSSEKRRSKKKRRSKFGSAALTGFFGGGGSSAGEDDGGGGSDESTDPDSGADTPVPLGSVAAIGRGTKHGSSSGRLLVAPLTGKDGSQRKKKKKHRGRHTLGHSSLGLLIGRKSKSDDDTSSVVEGEQSSSDDDDEYPDPEEAGLFSDDFTSFFSDLTEEYEKTMVGEFAAMLSFFGPRTSFGGSETSGVDSSESLVKVSDLLKAQKALQSGATSMTGERSPSRSPSPRPGSSLKSARKAKSQRLLTGVSVSPRSPVVSSDIEGVSDPSSSFSSSMITGPSDMTRSTSAASGSSDHRGRSHDTRTTKDRMKKSHPTRHSGIVASQRSKATAAPMAGQLTSGGGTVIAASGLKRLENEANLVRSVEAVLFGALTDAFLNYSPSVSGPAFGTVSDDGPPMPPSSSKKHTESEQESYLLTVIETARSDVLAPFLPHIALKIYSGGSDSAKLECGRVLSERIQTELDLKQHIRFLLSAYGTDENLKIGPKKINPLKILFSGMVYSSTRLRTVSEALRFDPLTGTIAPKTGDVYGSMAAVKERSSSVRDLRRHAKSPRRSRKIAPPPATKKQSSLKKTTVTTTMTTTTTEGTPADPAKISPVTSLSSPTDGNGDNVATVDDSELVDMHGDGKDEPILKKMVSSGLSASSRSLVSTVHSSDHGFPLPPPSSKGHGRSKSMTPEFTAVPAPLPSSSSSSESKVASSGGGSGSSLSLSSEFKWEDQTVLSPLETSRAMPITDAVSFWQFIVTNKNCKRAGFEIEMGPPLKHCIVDPCQSGSRVLTRVAIRKVMASNAKPLLIDLYVKKPQVSRKKKSSPPPLPGARERRKSAEDGRLGASSSSKSPTSTTSTSPRSTSPVPFIEQRSSTVILKEGDDLRKDSCVMQMFKYFNHLWRLEGLMHERINVSTLCYKVIPMSSDFGVIELINGCIPLRHVSKLEPYLKKDERRLHNLIATAAGSYIASFIMGARDRHFDNILIRQTDCSLFHIDFNYVLGEKVGFDACPFGITKKLFKVMGGVKNSKGTAAASKEERRKMFKSAAHHSAKSQDDGALKKQRKRNDVLLWEDNGYDLFVDLCVKAFSILRKYWKKIVEFALLLFSPHLCNEKVLRQFIKAKLRIDKSEKKCEQWLRKQLREAPFNRQTRWKNRIHKMATDRIKT